MERFSRREWIGDWLWFLAWGIVSSFWCVSAASQLGATFDEPIYLVKGLEHWRTGSHKGLMQLGTMPLPVDVATLPLYLWERWHGLQLDPSQNMESLLPWARAGTLLFWWLLLACGRLIGRQLAGPWGGRLAVALLACEPSLLAHASLATTDIAVTACLLALVYAFRTGRDAGWLRRVGVPACWYAAAVLAKASGLVFGPLCMLVVEAERLLSRSCDRDQLAAVSWPARLKAFACDGTQIFWLGLVLVFVYCGSDWEPQASFLKWAHTLPDNAAGRSMTWLAEHLCIFSNAGEGLARQIKHNIRGHGVFLLGQYHPRAFWYYFPVALTIKLSLLLLSLPLVLLVLRPRSLANWACVIALVLFGFSLTCRVQIGIRLVLPLIALAAIGLAAATVRAIEASAPWRRRLLVATAVAGIAWTACSAVRVWPHGLCYTNELWGGTRDGYRLLSDSNYDWGQGLKELARWQQTHHAEPLDVWYFGTDPVLRKLPMREVPFHVLPLRGAEEVLAQVRGHYLAVSTTLLYGVVGKHEGWQQAVAVLRSRRPIARTTTFHIYDFTASSDPAAQARAPAAEGS